MIKSVFVYTDCSGIVTMYNVSDMNDSITTYTPDSVPVSIIAWINHACLQMEVPAPGFIWYRYEKQEEDGKEVEESSSRTPLWLAREQYLDKYTESAPVLNHMNY